MATSNAHANGAATLLAAMFISLIPASPHAATLRWSEGGTDLRLSPGIAVRCTLLATSDLTSSPDAYRIVWAGDGALKFESTAAPVSPAVSGDPITPDQMSDAACGRTQVDLPRTSSPSATFVITVLSGTAFSITAVEIAGSRALRSPLRRQPVATINGGAGDPFRPELIAATMRVVGDSVLIEATGVGLSEVREAALIGRGGSVHKLTAECVGDTLVRARCSLSVAHQGRRFAVADGARAGSSLPLDGRWVVVPGQPRQILALLKAMQSVSEVSALPGITRVAPLVPAPRSQAISTGAGSALALSRFLILDISSDVSCAQALGSVRRLASIETADSVTEDVEPAFDPNDELWGEQWALHDIGGSHCSGTIYPEPNSSIHMSSAWDTPTQGPAPVIGIIDTGVDETPFDLREPDPRGISYALGSNPNDPYPGIDAFPLAGGHGTPVASIAAALTDNEYGMASASRAGTFLSLKWYGSSGGSWPTIVKCLNYVDSLNLVAPRSVPIVNMSLDGAASGTEAVSLAIACKNTFLHGGMIVAASGDVHDSSATYPGILNDFVTTVGATLWNNKYWTAHNAWPVNSDSARGSRYGSRVDLVAPGGIGITAAWACDDPPYCGQHYFSGSSQISVITGGRS